jgi:hypothetical protein
MQSGDFWRNLNSEFTALAGEEWASVPDPADNRRLRAYGNTDSAGNYVGGWSLSEGPNENFRARFAETATHAGHALDPPQGTEGLDFWLHRLFLDLLELNELRTDRSPLVVGHRDKGGIIREVCEASATYCSRLGRAALDRAAETPPKLAFESEQGTQNATGSLGAFGQISTWEELEISFLSDERVQLTVGVHTETRNYAELGFGDGRSHKPNLAWQMLRSLAEQGGTLETSTASTWPKVEKRIQEIRRVLRKHFAISADPLPFIRGNGYQACLRIHCSRSFKT